VTMAEWVGVVNELLAENAHAMATMTHLSAGLGGREVHEGWHTLLARLGSFRGQS
jgi:hypothetical protein